jgi:phosphoglycerate kinase
MKIKILNEIKNLQNKIVLVRVDFNVPLKNGKIKELYKIEKSLPTIQYLRESGATVVLMSHLGRPKGVDKKLSLKPVSVALQNNLKITNTFINISDADLKDKTKLQKLQKKIQARVGGEVVLLENVRFLKGEEKNNQNVAKALASLADTFVLDGFAVAHRDSASVTGVAKYLPTYAGLLMEEELTSLNRLFAKPKKPFVVVLGGAKMETKIPLIKKLLPLASQIIIGGGIVNTCLWAKGFKVGRSIIDKNSKKIALQLVKNKKIIMPVDLIIGDEFGKQVRVIDLKDKNVQVPPKLAIYDIGPKSITLFSKYLKKANTLVWNGSMGMFEVPIYRWGSESVARLFGSRAKGQAFGVTGGGETVELVKKVILTRGD